MLKNMVILTIDHKKGGDKVIFEANKNNIRKAYNIISKALTVKNRKDEKYRYIKISVTEAGAYFMCKNEHINLITKVPDARVILTGSTVVDIDEFETLIKAFKKNVPIIMELEEEILRIDDGYDVPEEMDVKLDKKVELVSLVHDVFLYLDKDIFQSSLEELIPNINSSVIKNSNYLKIVAGKDLRLYSVDHCRVSQKIIKEEAHEEKEIYIDKNGVNQINKLLKECKDKEVSLCYSKNYLIVKTETMDMTVKSYEDIEFMNIALLFNREDNREYISVNKEQMIQEINYVKEFLKNLKEIKSFKEEVLYLAFNEEISISGKYNESKGYIVNFKYFEDVVRNIKNDKFYISIPNINEPIWIKYNNELEIYDHIILPILSEY